MGLPGTGSTNQTLTFAAAKKLAGKAHTSNLKEIYNETIPSNVQIDTTTIFGNLIPQTVTTTDLYSRFSASSGEPYTAEYVEFYVESINGTSYDANDGTFGDVGFGGGDEAQSSGPHGYKLVLTSSYESLSSGSWAGTGFFVNNQVVNESNGGLQLINPSFGPQTGNNYGLTIYTAHPDNGGLQIPTTSPIDWYIDYFNGIIFVQDYLVTAVPTYARGFIYVGKFSDEVISDISSSAGGEITIKDEGSDLTTAVASIDFVGSGVTATNSGNDVTVTIDGGGSATAAGPTGSLQFHKEDGEITGSTNLLFVTSSNTLNLTGTLNVSGAINANELNINVTNKTVINLEASGSTKFGDTDDDTHQFTGSILVNGSIIRARESVTSSPYTISATDYVIGVDTATIGAASTINLPVANTLQDGQFFIIKDEGGDAQTYNIKITASAADLIDGVSEVYLESPYGAISIYTNGSDKFFIY